MLFTRKLCLTLCDLMVTKPTRLLCPWNSPGKNYWSGLPFLSPEDLPDLGIESASSALAGRFLTTDPPGKSMKIYSEITDFFFFFLATPCGRISVLPPGIEPAPPAVGARRLNHGTAKKVPTDNFLFQNCIFLFSKCFVISMITLYNRRRKGGRQAGSWLIRATQLAKQEVDSRLQT